MNHITVNKRHYKELGERLEKRVRLKLPSFPPLPADESI